MKNLLRAFCIVVMMFVSLCANAGEKLSVTDTISATPTMIYVANNECENSIASSNFYNSEIVNLSEHKQNFSASNLYKASAQVKFLSIIFAQNYNRTLLSNSHRISHFLRNEICTRAP